VVAAEEHPGAGDDDHGRDGDLDVLDGARLAGREREAEGAEDRGGHERPGVALPRVGEQAKQPDRREAASQRQEEDGRRGLRGERGGRDEEDGGPEAAGDAGRDRVPVLAGEGEGHQRGDADAQEGVLIRLVGDEASGDDGADDEQDGAQQLALRHEAFDATLRAGGGGLESGHRRFLS
jgi:hypothetical protein